MKNLKTIITILVFTFVAFGCQDKSEDFLETNNPRALRNLLPSANTFIFVKFEKNTSKEQKELVRNKFESHLDFTFVNIEQCNEGETWEVLKISYLSFQYLLSDLDYIDIDPTLLGSGSSGDDDDYPDYPSFELPTFMIKYNSNCYGVIY